MRTTATSRSANARPASRVTRTSLAGKKLARPSTEPDPIEKILIFKTYFVTYILSILIGCSKTFNNSKFLK